MTFRDDLRGVGGEVGRDLAAVDWESTSLGDPEEWPASLRTVVRILLTSRFAMWMGWGPELTFFCNDAYRRDTLGDKYPWALGRPTSEVWAEVWEDVVPRIDHVMRTGEATWDEALLLFLERRGYVEETYHTFSYSPLTDDDGETCGLLCVVNEDTGQVIATRRMNTLQALGQRPTGLDEVQAIGAACQRLAGDPRSLPFTMVYLFDHADGSAHLRGTSGIAAGHPAAPHAIGADEDHPVWPSSSALAGETVLVEHLVDRWPDLPTGAWREPPAQALVVPLLHPVEPAPYGFLVAGVNPHRRVDRPFEAFVTLVATQLSSIITDARAYEFERQRAETLTELDQAKTDFFTNVSHEFRTPLTLLLGPAEEALADDAAPLPDGQRERLEVIRRNGLRLLKLVNSLLDFSSLDGPGGARFEPVDLARYTRELAGMFESAAERVGVRLEVDCPPLPAEVYVDQEQWAKIVLNLVSNALKFTFEGTITVRLRLEDDEAVLAVADTGSGIPEADLPRLFERFHRVRGARGRSNEGSGIGLALVAELTAAHGGTVDVESQEGEGTTFTVRVPTGRAHLPAEQVADEPAPVEPARHASGFVSEVLQWVRTADDRDDVAPEPEETVGESPSMVLVVDDNDDMREYVAQLLRPLYRVVTAVDGLDALGLATDERPDLVLTDVMMPRLDGFGLLRRLHEDPDLTTVPVIMLSARAGDDGVVEGLEAGADDYLVKPFSARELLARVAVNLELDRVRRIGGTLERSQELLGQAQRLAKVGSWELDLGADRLWGTDEFHRIVGVDPEELERRGFRDVLGAVVHPEDVETAQRAVEAIAVGEVAEALVRIHRPGSDPADERRVLHVWIQVVPDDEGRRLLRGSVQDVTEQRRVERAMAAAAAREEAAAREHAIAQFLQRSLLPERTYELEQLEVATYYRAGVEGT